MWGTPVLIPFVGTLRSEWRWCVTSPKSVHLDVGTAQLNGVIESARISSFERGEATGEGRSARGDDEDWMFGPRTAVTRKKCYFGEDAASKLRFASIPISEARNHPRHL